MAKVPVAADAKTKSYYKYYELDIAGLTPVQRAFVADCKRDKKDALPIEERNSVLSDMLPKETGYYPLKGGGVLVASNIDMPDITPDMLYWWFAWHGLDPFRYSIWDPEDHYSVQINDEGRKRSLDPAVPLEEKTWGATHTVLESIGGPPDEIVIMFKNPNDMGIDTRLIGTPACRFIVIANALLGKRKVPVVMLETASDRPEGGLSYHARFWIGYHIVDGVGKRLIPWFIKPPAELLRGLVGHNIKEFSHLGKILPAVYAEEKDNW